MKRYLTGTRVMEDWEKRFAELEAEVDKQFEKEKEKATRKPCSQEQSPSKEDKVDDDGQESFFDGLKQEATNKALEKASEKALLNINPRVGAVYGVGALLTLWLLWTNLFKLLFIGVVVGSLYYFLVWRKGEEQEGEEDFDDDIL